MAQIVKMKITDSRCLQRPVKVLAASTEIAHSFASFKLGKLALSGARPLALTCAR
jgi:hypothetical protein